MRAWRGASICCGGAVLPLLAVVMQGSHRVALPYSWERHRALGRGGGGGRAERRTRANPAVMVYVCVVFYGYGPRQAGQR